MKTIKSLLLIAATLISFSIQAQTDEYRQIVTQLITKGQQMEQIQSQIAQAFKDPNDPKTQKVQAYMTSEEFMNDFVTLYEEALRPRLTLEQLKEVAAFVTSDSCKLLEQKSQILSQQMQDENSPAFMTMMELVEGMTSAIEGVETKPIAYISNDEAFKKAFHDYYMASGTNKIMESSMQSIIQMVAGQLSAADQAQVQQVISTMTNYMTANLEPTVMKMMDGLYTISDFNYYIRNMNTPSYQAYIDASTHIDLGGWLTKIFLMVSE